MGQMGFFDLSNRYAGLDAKADPLVKLNAMVPWEDFRPRLEAVWRRPPGERKSKAGRKPWDAVVIFKAIVLCELYNLSDEQFEYQLRDRLSFMRFLGLGLEDRVPDATTVWLYREQFGPGRGRRRTVRRLRRAPEGAGLAGDGRADDRRLDRAGAQAAQRAR